MYLLGAGTHLRNAEARRSPQVKCPLSTYSWCSGSHTNCPTKPYLQTCDFHVKTCEKGGPAADSAPRDSYGNRLLLEE